MHSFDKNIVLKLTQVRLTLILTSFPGPSLAILAKTLGKRLKLDLLFLIQGENGPNESGAKRF